MVTITRKHGKITRKYDKNCEQERLELPERTTEITEKHGKNQ